MPQLRLAGSQLYRFFISFFIISFFAILNIAPLYANNDLLNQAFDEAKTYDTVINPGNDKDAVGGQVFNKTLEVNIGGTTEFKEPYLIRFTKLILRITIAISVPIIIWAGIMYATAFGEPNKQKKAQNIVIYALAGIFLALSSLAIVQLVLSITRNSLEF